MSDFDKEAERERLREKYEREQEKRQSTERMSELLLKGATMTNAHCENCGDPIFRYDGEEFCPTCQQVVAEGDADAADAEASDAGAGDAEEAETGGVERGGDETRRDETAGAGTGTDETETTGGGSDETEEPAEQAPGGIEIREPSGPQVGEATDANGAAAPERAAGDAETTAEGAAASPQSHSQAQSQAGSGSQSGSAPSSRSSGRADRSPASQSVPSVQPASGAGGDTDDALVAARASLTRTLLQQARQAENAEDPTQARDHLAAAREAAESLSALSSH